jgi:hypothetical protein
MAQFDCHALRTPRGIETRVVWLSADVLIPTGLVIVAPLAPDRGPAERLSRLHLCMGEEVLRLDQLLSLPRTRLGPVLGNVSTYRDAIIAGLDFLFTGY